MQSDKDPTLAIVGYVVAGLVGLCVLYYLRQWCSYKVEQVQSDANRTLYVTSIADTPKPRFPIFAYLVSLFVVVEPVEVDFVATQTADSIGTTERSEDTSSVRVSNEKHHGAGVDIQETSDTHDLEANMSSGVDINGTTLQSNNILVHNHVAESITDTAKAMNQNSIISHSRKNSNASSDVGAVLSEESSFASFVGSESAYSGIEGAVNDSDSERNEHINNSNNTAQLYEASDGSSVDFSVPSCSSGDD